MRFPGVLAAVVACVSLAGCSGGGGSGGSSSAGSDALAGLDPVAVDSTSLAAAFSIASAPRVYSMLALPIYVASATSGGCPVIEQDENSSSVTGGCTDTAGVTWAGELRMVGFDEVEVEMNGFGFASTTSCNAFSLPGSATFDGRARIVSAPGAMSFEADFTLEPSGPACGRYDSRIAIDYEGESANAPDTDLDGHPDYSVWNGGGRLGIEGIGRVRAGTEDERLDGLSIGPAGTITSGTSGALCLTEPSSGLTRLLGGGVTAELLYDGALACNESVPWSLDGVTQTSQVNGVACSATAERGSSPLACLGLLALAITISGRRPAATSRSSR